MTIPEVSAAQAHRKSETQTPTEASRTAILAAELTTAAVVATLSSTAAAADITTKAEAHVELRVAGAGAEAATPAGETEWAEMTQQRKWNRSTVLCYFIKRLGVSSATKQLYAVVRSICGGRRTNRFRTGRFLVAME